MTRVPPFRLPSGGLIDRSRPMAFTFDGKPYTGFAGDTLASALLANGVHLVGRSFKYHRPRGVLSAGFEEANAIVALGAGDRAEPNIPATLTRLSEGLAASSQNRWPTLRFDLMAVNDRLSRFLSAGFYYKTFMWPAAGWRFYERFIRRAAGMGTAPNLPDEAVYDTVHDHCDVMIVGSGPAGLSAALAAGRAGARVLLVEQRAEFGGALRRERMTIDGLAGHRWAERVIGELQSRDNVTLLRDAVAFGYYDHNFIGVVETPSARTEAGPREKLHLVRARRVILATGAIEQPMTFPDNDRPGIMLAGAARAYLNEYAVKPGQSAVVYTTSDDAYRTAAELAAVGVDVKAVVDARGDVDPALLARMQAVGITTLPGHQVVGSRGRHRLRSIKVAPVGGGAGRTLVCDLLCMSSGWAPAIHLQSQTGAKPQYDPDAGVFLPGEAAQPECSIGGARGAGDLATCLSQGMAAGASAAQACGCHAPPMPMPGCDDGGFARRLRVERGPRIANGRKKQFVDFQMDVTLADVALAKREGFVSVEHLKRYTTLGMGTDQGKTSNLAGLTAMGELRGLPPSDVGTTTFRPPASPVSMAALAGRAVGHDYAPVRLTPMHEWHLAAGARLVENGLWLRPSVYPRAGEAVTDAILREAQSVRSSVGMVDVTTLGKIDVQGPDAALFLDRVYTNTIARIKPGRISYSVMLREDGHVLDDGVVCRLAADHYHLSTSTGHVAHVLSHLERLHQVHWPDLQVSITDVTDNWAVMAVAGPNARALLSQVFDGDLSPEALPVQGIKTCSLDGVAVRLFRLSFSGELAFEVNVPAEHGLGVWKRLLAAGEGLGLCPFGTEAMGMLRIEKGYIASGEIDGRTAPQDLGLEGRLSPSKAFVGKAALDRPGLTAPDRPRLVGLVPVDRRSVLRAGAHLLMAPAPATPAREPVVSIGRITSATYSVTLGHPIALALLSGGRDRIGEIIHAAFPLKDECVPVEVVEPVFYDPSGGRACA